VKIIDFGLVKPFEPERGSEFVTITTGGPGCYIDVISGIPQSTWFLIGVEVKSNTGGAVTIYGINVQEQVLTAADLP